jgi:hypothetical protein
MAYRVGRRKTGEGPVAPAPQDLTGLPRISAQRGAMSVSIRFVNASTEQNHPAGAGARLGRRRGATGAVGSGAVAARARDADVAAASASAAASVACNDDPA